MPCRSKPTAMSRFDKGAANYSGHVQDRCAGADKARTPAEAARGRAATPGYRLNGKFSLDHERLAFDEFRVRDRARSTNPYSADGNGFVDLGAEAALRGDGRWRAGALRRGDRRRRRRRRRRWRSALRRLQEALADLPRPTIPGTLEVNLPAVVAGDTTIRDVRLSAEPATDGWTVKSLAATLPGRTTLEADGHADAPTASFGFKGSLLLAIGQPSGFAAWVSQDVDDAIRRLPAAGFQRQGRPDQRTPALRRSRTGARQCDIPRPCREQPAATAPSPSVAERWRAARSTSTGWRPSPRSSSAMSGANRFADRDLDLQVKAGPVSAGGLTADTVDTALRLREGAARDRPAVDRRAGRRDGQRDRDRSSDFPDNPAGNIDASLVAVDLAPLIDALAACAHGDNAVREGPRRARRGATRTCLPTRGSTWWRRSADNGDGSTGFAVSAQGKAGGTALSATLSGNGRPERCRRARRLAGAVGTQ